MTELLGKTALIIGGSRGIGAATARELIDAGANVALASRKQAECQRLVDEIDEKASDRGTSVIALSCDVTQYAQVASTVEKTIDRFGSLDILINSAGIIEPIAYMIDVDPAAWAQNLSVNLIGAFNAIHAVIQPMKQRSGGIIVNLSSGAASRPKEGWGAYCTSKAGLAMITQSISLELEQYNIRVFGFRPGPVDTDMHIPIRASGINEISRLPREDLLPATVPAKFICWLCKGSADELAGQEVDIRSPDLCRRAGLTAG